MYWPLPQSGREESKEKENAVSTKIKILFYNTRHE